MALNMHRWQFVLAWQFAALTLSVVTSHFIIYLKKFSRWIFRERLSSKVIFTLVFAHIERVYLKIATKKIEWKDKTNCRKIIWYILLLGACLLACVFLSILQRFFWWFAAKCKNEWTSVSSLQQRANDESFLMALDCYFITYY